MHRPIRFARALLALTLACSDAAGPAGLTPHFAYTVAPINGGSVFFTGPSAVWYAGPHDQSGSFFMALTGADKPGPINFDCPLFNAGAAGPRFRSPIVPDTIRVGAFAAETTLADLGTCSGTWYADSGKLILRQISGGFLVGDLDIWLSTAPGTSVIRMSGTFVAGPP